MTMLNMRRLELALVAAGLLVLLFASKPPKSGNAQIGFGGIQAQVNTPSQNDAPNSIVSTSADAPVSNEAPAADPLPRPKRIAAVDARRTSNPKYQDIMYGEVGVRWVWDGQKSVPKKVCIVDEGRGVTSIWSFDDPGEGVTITETQ